MGSHFSLIKRVGISSDMAGSPGELIWHLDMLIKFNYIKKLKVKNYTIFLPIDVDDESGIIYFFLRDDLYRKIINHVFSSEPKERAQIHKLIIYFFLRDDLYRKIINHVFSSEPKERAQIHKLIGENRETIYYRIQNLIDFQILELLEDNKVKLNPKKSDIVIQVLDEISNIRELEYIKHG